MSEVVTGNAFIYTRLWYKLNHVGVTFNTDIISSEYNNLDVLEALVNSTQVNMQPTPGTTRNCTTKSKYFSSISSSKNQYKLAYTTG